MSDHVPDLEPGSSSRERVRNATGVDPATVFDHAKIEQAVRLLFEAIGEDPDREGLRDTPARVAREYDEIFAGLLIDPRDVLSVLFEEGHDEMVMVRDIPLFSMCVHSKQIVNRVGGGVPARDVRVGDWLWTLDDDGRLARTEVVATSQRKVMELVRLRVQDRWVAVSREHPVRVPDGWTPAWGLEPGDKVLWTNPRQLNKRRLQVNEGYHLGYVIGAVASDGSIQEGRRISLVVKDHDFAERFRYALFRAFGIDRPIEPLMVPSGYLEREIPMNRVRVVSRHLGQLLLHWFGGSKATTEFRFPRVALRSKDMMAGFLDGYCDGDGCEEYTRRGARIIVSKNRTFLEELAAVLGTKPGYWNADGVGQLRVPLHWWKPERGRPGFWPRDIDLLPSESDWVELDEVRTDRNTARPYRVVSFQCEPHPTFLVGGMLTHNCEHHLLPLVGRAHVAYIPNEKGQITGLSKIARLVDVVAKRPNLQERLTTTIADTLEEVLEPRGVLVVVEAQHLCMDMRGVRKPGSHTVTSAVRGQFRDDPRTRAEAMTLITRSDGGGYGG